MRMHQPDTYARICVWICARTSVFFFFFYPPTSVFKSFFLKARCVDHAKKGWKGNDKTTNTLTCKGVNLRWHLIDPQSINTCGVRTMRFFYRFLDNGVICQVINCMAILHVIYFYSLSLFGTFFCQSVETKAWGRHALIRWVDGIGWCRH